MKGRVVAAVFVPAVFVLGATVAGCGGATTGTTCDDYAAQDDATRGETVLALLEPHGISSRDLESYRIVVGKVNEFCGLRGGSAPDGGEATQNSMRTIDEAVEWDSLTS